MPAHVSDARAVVNQLLAGGLVGVEAACVVTTQNHFHAIAVELVYRLADLGSYNDESREYRLLSGALIRFLTVKEAQDAQVYGFDRAVVDANCPQWLKSKLESVS